MVPKKAAGQHGHLGRAAHVAPGGGQRKVDEELAQARAVQEGPEQDEEEDEGGGHAQRRAEQAFRGQVHLGDDALHAEAAMPQHAGDEIAELGVKQEDHGHQGDGQAHDAPRRLQHQDDGRAAEIEVHVRGRPGIQDDHVVIPDDVAADGRPGDGKDDVVPGELVDLVGPGRIKQIDQRQHEAQMDGALDLRREGPHGRRIEMEGRKGDAEQTNEDVHPALEGAVDRFLVVFGHDLGNVHGLLTARHGHMVHILMALLFQGKAAGPLLVNDPHPFFMTHLFTLPHSKKRSAASQNPARGGVMYQAWGSPSI